MNCRHCGTTLKNVFLDLGFSPPSNAYLTKEQLSSPEVYYPLKLFVCDNCWLVQTDDYTEADDLFDSDYAYFSSVSKSWLKHAKDYADMIIDKLSLNASSHVIEVAANDGYLLKNFVEKGIPCLGIEPTDSTATAAESLNIPIRREFFGNKYAETLVNENLKADLILGNNVFAHVPDINDFTAGLRTCLKETGTVTLEFPHLMRLIESNQFDTVYHEHFSYLSLQTVSEIFKRAGLRVYDVEELTTHGGSIRVYGCHHDDDKDTSNAVFSLLEEEIQRGLNKLITYKEFQKCSEKIKDDLNLFLIKQKQNGKKVVAYGAAAKGNTLLNFSGVKTDLISYVCDAAPSKQGKFLPGTHIPILHPDTIKKDKPDIILILPWNIKDEIMDQLAFARDWGCEFVAAIPEIKSY